MLKTPQVIMAFDFGLKRIGMAVGQTITHTASPLDILPANDGNPLWEYCDKQIKRYRPHLLIVGIPVKEQDNNVTITEIILTFAQALHERYGIQVVGVDERFTTKEARYRLEDLGYKNVQDMRVDSVSAALLIESWFQSPEAIHELGCN